MSSDLPTLDPAGKSRSVSQYGVVSDEWMDGWMD